MIDTHESIKSLKSAGFNELQAEAIVEQFRKAWDTRIADLATKMDIQEVRREIGDARREIGDVRRDMKEMELRLTIKPGAMLAASIAIVAALVKLL